MLFVGFTFFTTLHPSPAKPSMTSIITDVGNFGGSTFSNTFRRVRSWCYNSPNTIFGGWNFGKLGTQNNDVSPNIMYFSATTDCREIKRKYPEASLPPPHGSAKSWRKIVMKMLVTVAMTRYQVQCNEHILVPLSQ